MDGSRDEWMKRTGPFYPLVVGFKLTTALPVAAALEPTPEDLTRSAPWLPAVGLCVGAGLALVAWLLLATPLVPAIVVALIVSLGFFVSGAWAERGFLRALERLLPGWTAAHTGPLLAAALIRAACLMGTAPAAWAAALLLSFGAGRLAIVIALRFPKSGDDQEGGTYVALAKGTQDQRFIAAVAASSVMMLLVAGWAGFYALCVTGVVGALLARHWRSASRDATTAAAAAALAEIATLLVVAGVSPANVSPLIGG